MSNKQSTKESSIQNSGCYNFLANLSNQANLTNAYSTSPFQANAIFVLVSPYYVEKFNLEGFDLNINIDDKGTVCINGEAFSTFEVKPGIKVFGISKRN
ncbi:hypothetical protein BJL90_17315 [Clostridium formicaceticum]|uniref:Uncharacterized protein n=1 Tax=Clostridium formicaceticum TaxID=1497 RepID=A0ABN4THL7_9CLOT|nr:hypothetical protein BJL90_17315 [Clostridium formicaceticum]